MKLIISIFFSSIFIASTSAGGSSVSIPSSPCQDSLWPGQCFTDGASFTSCNNKWTLKYAENLFTLTDNSINFVYNVYSNPIPTCQLQICITLDGTLERLECSVVSYTQAGVALAKIEDNGSITYYDSAGRVIESDPPSLWQAA